MGSGGNEPQCESNNKASVDGGDGDDCICVCCQIYCFHCDSMIKVLEKNNTIINKKISKIKKGEQVLTFNGKMKQFTKVTKIKKNEGLFEFYTIKCKDSKSNIKSISITGNHTMIVYEEKKNEIKLKYADQVKIGDLFMTNDGFFEVYEINREKMYGSYEIRVENGTILANDILVSTLYLDKNEMRKNNQEIWDSTKNKIEILN